MVLLSKNGLKSSTALSNYRPISLSACMYKVYASILKDRPHPYVEPYLRPTQYGFRQLRSTSQLLHIIRQLIQAHERQRVPLHFVFLYWAKAFDSLTHAAISHSLAYIQSRRRSLTQSSLCMRIHLSKCWTGGNCHPHHHRNQDLDRAAHYPPTSLFFAPHACLSVWRPSMNPDLASSPVFSPCNPQFGTSNLPMI